MRRSSWSGDGSDDGNCSFYGDEHAKAMRCVALLDKLAAVYSKPPARGGATSSTVVGGGSRGRDCGTAAAAAAAAGTVTAAGTRGGRGQGRGRGRAAATTAGIRGRGGRVRGRSSIYSCPGSCNPFQNGRNGLQQ